MGFPTLRARVTGAPGRRLNAGAALLIGLAVPSLFAGRVPLGVCVGLAAVMLAVAGPRPSGAEIKAMLRAPLGLALSATFALWLISAAGSLKPDWSLMIWGQSAALLLAAVYVQGWLAADDDARELALKALVAGALFGALVSFVALHLWYEALVPFRTRPIENFPDVRQTLRAYGSVVPVLMPAVVLAGVILGRAWRIAALAYVPLGVVIVYGMGSIAGLLGYGGLAAALLAARLLVVLPQTPARLAAGALFACGAAIAYVVVTLVPAPPYACEALALPTWLVDPHRQIIWGFALERALDAPWFGYGVDIGGSLPGAKVPLPKCVGQNYLPSHAHNWMIEIFVETGVFGLAGAAAALGLFARGLIQLASRGEAAAYAAIGLAGAFWVSGLVNFSIWAAWWQWTFLGVAAVTLAAMGHSPRAAGPESANSRKSA